MPSIVVLRGAGDKPGEDIEDGLLSEVSVQLARGRAELDSRSTIPQEITNTTVFRQGVMLGQLSEVHDAAQGKSYRGKITAISHRIDGQELTTQVSIRKPLED